MKNGFTLLGMMLVLLGISGVALGGTVAASNPAAEGLAPEGVECRACSICTFTYPSGDFVSGHYTQPFYPIYGRGLGGNVHDCAIGAWDSSCPGPSHPDVYCKAPQAALPPADEVRFDQLVTQLAAGDPAAAAALQREFPSLVTIDQGFLLFAGCRDGVYSGGLPLPQGVDLS